jgi:hypothetical protein
MLKTGDFIQIRFQHEARNRKPIGIHWLQATSVALFSAPSSTAIWPYRLPSALAATIAALLTSTLGATLLSSRRAGFIAGIVMASALGLVVEAHLAKTDAALLAAVVAGQLALGIMYVRARVGDSVHWRLAVAFWTAQVVGILLKGPAAPALALLTVATLSIADRDIRWIKVLRPVPGLVLTTDGDSLVRRDRTSHGGTFSYRIALAGPSAEVSRRARITWRFAWIVPRVVARELLAGLAVFGSGCVLRLATAACSGAGVPDRLAVAGLDLL